MVPAARAFRWSVMLCSHLVGEDSVSWSALLHHGLWLFMSVPSASWVFLRFQAGVLGSCVGVSTFSEVFRLCEGVGRKLPVYFHS